jgi:hypothetical protein
MTAATGRPGGIECLGYRVGLAAAAAAKDGIRLLGVEIWLPAMLKQGAHKPIHGQIISRVPGDFRALRGHSATLAPLSYNALVAVMNTFLGIVIAAVSVCTFAGVIWLFIWAAKKDGEEDRAIQRRLGIRRRTRLGR